MARLLKVIHRTLHRFERISLAMWATLRNTGATSIAVAPHTTGACAFLRKAPKAPVPQCKQKHNHHCMKNAMQGVRKNVRNKSTWTHKRQTQVWMRDEPSYLTSSSCLGAFLPSLCQPPARRGPARPARPSALATSRVRMDPTGRRRQRPTVKSRAQCGSNPGGPPSRWDIGVTLRRHRYGRGAPAARQPQGMKDLADIGHTCLHPGQTRPKWAETGGIRPNSAELGLDVPNFGTKLTSIGRLGPESTQIWVEFD